MTDYDQDNIFAKILAGEIPSVKIFENENVLAIMDAFPQSKGHALLIPKAPSRNLLDADPEQLARVIGDVQKLAIASKAAFNADGVRLAQFNESAAGQTVFHLHFHIIPAFEGVQMTPHASTMADMEELQAHAALLRAHLT